MNSAARSTKKRAFANLFAEALRHRDAGDFDRAARVLRELAKIRPNSAAVQGILGDVQWRQGQLNRAVQSFKRATQLSPSSELASLGLFHTLWESGRIKSAKAEMKRFMSIGDSREYASIASSFIPKAPSSNARKSAKNHNRAKLNGISKNAPRLKARPANRVG